MVAIVAEPRREAVVDVGCAAAVANQEAADAQPFIVVKRAGAEEYALLVGGPLRSAGKKGDDARSYLSGLLSPARAEDLVCQPSCTASAQAAPFSE